MSKRYAIIQPLILATILTLGFGCVISLLGAWIVSVAAAARSQPWVSDNVYILEDGSAVIFRYTECKGAWQSEYRDLSGHSVARNVAENTSPGAIVQGPDDLDRYHYRFPLEPQSRAASYIVRHQNHTYYWYCIHDGKREGDAYFVGYDAESQHLVGYIGRAGFSQQLPSEDNRFPLDGRGFVRGTSLQPVYGGGVSESSKAVMISDDRLLQIDLQNQSIKTIKEAPGMVSITLSRGDIEDEERFVNEHFLLVLRTTNRVVLLDVSGNQKQSFAIPEEMQGVGFTFWRVGGERAVFGQNRLLPHSRKEKLIWEDASGKVLRQEEATLAGQDQTEATAGKMWAATLVLPEPISSAAVMFGIYPLEQLSLDKAKTYAETLATSVSLLWINALAVCGLTAALAWLCYRRQRLMAAPWTWVWVVFVLLFGVPGYLAYRFHSRWPVLETCHVCGRAVPRDREKCAACGSPFPVPAPKGIEVFA
jgi:hypothetical protein